MNAQLTTVRDGARASASTPSRSDSARPREPPLADAHRRPEHPRQHDGDDETDKGREDQEQHRAAVETVSGRALRGEPDRDGDRRAERRDVESWTRRRPISSSRVNVAPASTSVTPAPPPSSALTRPRREQRVARIAPAGCPAAPAIEATTTLPAATPSTAPTSVIAPTSVTTASHACQRRAPRASSAGARRRARGVGRSRRSSRTRAVARSSRRRRASAVAQRPARGGRRSAAHRPGWQVERRSRRMSRAVLGAGLRARIGAICHVCRPRPAAARARSRRGRTAGVLPALQRLDARREQDAAAGTPPSCCGHVAEQFGSAELREPTGFSRTSLRRGGLGPRRSEHLAAGRSARPREPASSAESDLGQPVDRRDLDELAGDAQLPEEDDAADLSVASVPSTLPTSPVLAR